MDHDHGDLSGRAVGLGLRGLLEVGSIVEDGSEDAEERRKRIETEQNSSGLGAVLGVIAGLAMTVVDNAAAPEEHEDDYEDEPDFEQQIV